MKLNGYTNFELIYEGNSNIYIANREQDHQQVIIKSVVDEFHCKTANCNLAFEYSILKELNDIDGVIKAYGFLKSNGHQYLFLEAVDSVSLEQYLDENTLEYDEKLDILKQILLIIGKIHENGIIHKDINPSNIIVSNTDRKVRIIDFGIASLIKNEHIRHEEIKNIEGTIEYLSPEQTGRINRDVDYRTDYYSFGITAYKVLTGMLPFYSSDKLAFIHLHLANNLKELNESIDMPKYMLAIIKKLIAKDKEDRYQSVFGILSDIETFEIKQNDKNTDTFVLGQNDYISRLIIPDKLYGRENELSEIGSGLRKSIKDQSEICLVTGKPGIGKSTLVYEVIRNTLDYNYYLISAKADQYKTDVPYTVLIKAFENFLDLIFTESEEEIQYWKEKFLNALGSNGQLIIDMIPAFERIIGPQEPVVELGYNEEKNRFKETYFELLRVVSNKTKPIVIFLDNLQWCDSNTLELIKEIITNKIISHTYLIVSYRDNELNDNPELVRFINEIKSLKNIRKILLEPLKKHAILELLEGILGKNLEHINELVELIFLKTRGNPFFINEFIRNIYSNNDLYFDQKLKKWSWNLNNIEAMYVSDNVVDLVLNRISTYNPITQNALQVAASLGSRFLFSELIECLEVSHENLVKILLFLIKEDLIRPVDNSYRLLLESQSKVDIAIGFIFMHDRLQQASYNLVDKRAQKNNHFIIANTLKNYYRNSLTNENKRKLISHYLKSIDLIHDNSDIVFVLKLAYEVALIYRKTSAYKSAYNILHQFSIFIKKQQWMNEYTIVKLFMMEYASVAYLVNEHEIADATMSEVLSHTKTNFEKVEAYIQKVSQYITIGKMEESIVAGIKGLKLLDVKVPKNVSKLMIFEKYIKLNYRLKGLSIDDLYNKPEITNEHVKLEIKLWSNILPIYYIMGRTNTFAWIGLHLVDLTVKYGNFEESPFIFALYGMLLCSVFGKYEKGAELGKLAMDLNEVYRDIKKECRIYHGYATFILPWTTHPIKLNSLYKKGIEIGYNTGDYMYMSHIALSLYIWDPTITLEELSIEKNKQREIVKKAKYQDLLDGLSIIYGQCMNFRGLTDDKFSLNINGFDEKKCVAGMFEREFKTGITVYNLRKAEIYYLYGEFSKANEYILKTEADIQSIMGLQYTVRFTMLKALINAKLGLSIKPYMKKMKMWSEVNADNYLHLYTIMEGLQLDQKNNLKMSLNKYNQAIEFAKENLWYRDQALANELACNLLIKNNMNVAALGYFNESIRLYSYWGANAKINDMNEKYSNLIEIREKNRTKDLDNRSLSKTTDNNQLDIISILKSSHTISSEINFEELVKNILKITMENAGAVKTIFLTAEDNELTIFAEANFNQTKVTFYKDQEINLSKTVPMTLINYAKITLEAIIIFNAAEDNDFMKDEYIIKNRVKSILVLPLVRNKKLVAILYLENNLVKGAFSQERLDVLKLLSTEMVISIENAKLYRDLEVYNNELEFEVKKRTKEIEKVNINLVVKNEKLVKTQKQLSVMAMTDPLTGAYNRRCMQSKLEKGKSDFEYNESEFTLMLIDIDDFKKVNDNYGHDCGDFVLVELTNLIKQSIREQDELSRWGGEEFLLMLSNTKLNSGFLVAEKVRKNISSHFFNYKDIEIRVTITIGLSSYRDSAMSLDEVVKKCDNGLYLGKDKGKNRVEIVE